MSKKKGSLYGKTIAHEPTFHKTNIGRNPSLCKMNKSRRRSYKKYRGQGR
tara:strand:+ start:222 stop:371 length:150 start_codon:yes stop_codon:yes gene_type:complete